MLLPTRSQLARARDALRYSFWFTPLLVSVAALAVAIGTTAADATTPLRSGWLSALVPARSDVARDILRLTAGSAMTVATTAFSITIVALQLASSQLGPRLLRNFVRDRINQVVFGVLLGTFVYCLTVLHRMSVMPGPQAVPERAFVGAIVMTVGAVGFFIVFIHHIAVGVQADTVIADVAQELTYSLDRLFPVTMGLPPPVDKSPSRAGPAQRFPGPANAHLESPLTISTTVSGYIQAIDARLLMRIAEHSDVVVHLTRRPGDFVEVGSPVATVSPSEHLSPRTLRRLRGVFIIGTQRTQQQDVGFVFDQLVEIAIRALSPGVNDSFTAKRCIDRLSDALVHVGSNPFPSPYRYGRGGHLRVIASPLSFSVLVASVLNPIAESARDRSEVVLYLLRAIETIGRHAAERESREALRRFADYLVDLARTAGSFAATRQRVLDAHARAVGGLD